MVPHRLVLTSIFILLLSTIAASAAAPAEVDASLQKATAFLLDQEKNGNWEEVPAAAPDVRGLDINGGQWSGTSALATYALLCAHVSTSDPHVASAIDFLARTQTQGTYALGLRCLVWSALELNPKTKAAASRDMQQLLNNMRSKGPALGMFYYLPPLSAQGKVPRSYSYGQVAPPDDSEYDHSVSQFAALGLWALGRQGFEVPTQAWQLMDQGWRAHQETNGGWGYVFRPPATVSESHGKVTPSMTAAGVATLLITEECLHPGADCKGNLVDPAVELGIKHLADSFDGITDVDNFMDGKCETRYTLFGISRIGVASGRKYLGKLDWYRRGCDLLVSTQLPDGSWADPHSPTVETALGTLFLTYGGAPVVLNKLDYSVAGGKGPSAHWNQRPQDLLNFAGWMAKETEQRLNWQVVTLASPRQDLHEAPVLFISGNETLNLTPAEKNALRQFAEDGGLILGNADCNSPQFSKSFEKLGHDLFPNYEFRQLPDDHPIFSNEQYPSKKWKPRPQLMSMSNGVRELMMIPNTDLSQQFQLRNTVTHAALYQLADDIILYAMDKQGLRKKGNTFLVNEDPAIATASELKLVRLQYNGNWDPEPGGWRRLAAVLHNQDKVKLTVSVVQLGQGKLGEGKLPGARIAHLTGTDVIKLSPAELDELKKFTIGGGTLIIDAAGGSQTCAAGEGDIITKLFGDDGTKAMNSPLPPGSDLYKASGAPLTEFTYRAFARAVVGSLRSPRICVVKQNGRVVCYFSREDLSAGLVGQPIDGIIGYDPATATAIMRDILLSAGK